MAKYFLVMFTMLLMATSLKATYKTEIYQAYISNNMIRWKTVIDEMNRSKAKNNEFLIELINYQYGYVAWCIGNDNNKEAENYLDMAENNLETLEKQNFKPSMVNAYKSAFYGFRIGLNIFQAPFIGPKSVDCAQLAMKLDTNNPYGYIQYANAQFYMPAVFGGSKEVALHYYKKAETLMERNAHEIKNDWNYLSQLTIIAKAYTTLQKYTLAKAYYEKVLKIEPNFLWVKNELYPELLKNMK